MPQLDVLLPITVVHTAGGLLDQAMDASQSLWLSGVDKIGPACINGQTDRIGLSHGG